MARASSARRRARANPACRARGWRCRPRSCARSCGRRADGGRTSPSLPLQFGRPPPRAGGPTGRSPARRAASRRRATRHRRSARRRRARRLPPRQRGLARARRFSLSGGSGPCRKAILSTHRQPRCAFTRATITEALCCASSAKALSTLSTRVAPSDRRVRIAFGGPGRPLQLDRSGVTREGLADNGRPIGDQACFAQAARGQRLGDQARA